MIWLWLIACASAPLVIKAEVADGGIAVEANRRVDSWTLETEGGIPLSRAAAGTHAHLLAPIRSGARYRVRAVEHTIDSAIEIEAPAGPALVEVESPVGQRPIRVADGDVLPVTWITDDTHVRVRLTALQVGTVSVQTPTGEVWLDLPTPGARESVEIPVDDTLSVVAAGIRFSLEPRKMSLEEARDTLTIESSSFPTDSRGRVDPTRSADRIALPPRWWERWRTALGLGWRPRDDQVPWAHQGITLANRSDSAITVTLRAAVVDDVGTPHPAFASRLRDGREDHVDALLSIPPREQATAALPVYVDGEAIARAGLSRQVEITPIGLAEPLHVVSTPLTVSRGSSWAVGGLATAAGVSALGWLGLLGPGRRWVARARTPDLVTIALFASATWVVGAAFQVIGTTLGWLLGPFTPFVMGLPDQAFRACLLATLLTLLPRPGVLALATIVGFLLRALTFGSLHPTDLLYVGSAVTCLEVGAWTAGLTRSGQWRDGSPTERWLRFVVALGGANVAATAIGLVVSATLYRLYLADWYVIGLLVLPGFTYVAIGCLIAVPFADSLREVRR